jgi:hypothetical protein
VKARFFYIIIKNPVVAGKNKNMSEPMTHDCEECKKREEAAQEAEKTGMEVLVALMPLLTLTFFTNFGLF